MRLTRAEKDILRSVVGERLAGGVWDLYDALGMSGDIAEAERAIERLESILTKLAIDEERRAARPSKRKRL